MDKFENKYIETSMKSTKCFGKKLNGDKYAEYGSGVPRIADKS